jgi:hypothetical protein
VYVQELLQLCGQIARNMVMKRKGRGKQTSLIQVNGKKDRKNTLSVPLKRALFPVHFSTGPDQASFLIPPSGLMTIFSVTCLNQNISTLKLESEHVSETSVSAYKATWWHNPEDLNLDFDFSSHNYPGDLTVL